MNKTLSSLAIHLLLLACAIITLFPLFWMVCASMMADMESTRLPLHFWPDNPSFAQYQKLLNQLNLKRYLLNSLLVSTSICLSALFFNSLAGYAFAKLKFPGKDRLFKTLLAAMVIPGQVAMLPLFLILKQMGLINSYAGVIIPGMASIFGIFLIRQYAQSIPDSLLDAARIDGASEFRIYWSIVLPLCKPILITLTIFNFLGSWNDFLWPLIVLIDNDLYTLPVALANLLGEHVQDTELMMASSVLTLLPVMLVFLCLQKYYIEGLMAGGLKG